MPVFSFRIQPVLPLLCGLMLLGCQTQSPAASPAASPGAGTMPTASPTATGTPAPAASASSAPPSAPDDAFIPFGAIKGYRAKPEFERDLAFKTQDDEIDKSVVFCGQAAFDAAFSAAGAEYPPDSINFEQSCVLVIAKTTFAWRYTGAVTAIHLLHGQLNVDFSYEVSYSADPMLNDYGRTELFFTRFAKVKSDQFNLVITGKTSLPAPSPTPQPSAGARQTTGSNSASAVAQ